MIWMPSRMESMACRCPWDRPLMTISPESGSTTPPMILISVDLPEPFSPTRQWTSPVPMVRLTSLRACTPS